MIDLINMINPSGLSPIRSNMLGVYVYFNSYINYMQTFTIFPFYYNN